MEARMKNPAYVLQDTVQAINLLYKAAHSAGLDRQVLELVHMRASQINGCSACVESGARGARKAGITDERLLTISAWRETPWFTEAERAALELAESMTRLSDKADAVPDAIWKEAARHYDERALGAILLQISLVNVWNRVNVATRQVAGEWAATAAAKA